MRKVRILSIDGGGIRGILPGVILSRLEEKLQTKTNNPATRLADYFDFMAGTSTGGILTLAYLMPNKEGRPKFTAADAVNLYLDRGDEIFELTFWQQVKSGKGITDEKYNADALEEALDDNFGDTPLSGLLKPCIVSSYDLRNAKPHFFKQHKAHQKNYNFRVKDVARATSAAPTYFETARVKNENGTPFPLIDGGVFVNNPALVAYSEVRTIKFEGLDHLPTAKDMLLISIGTGSESKSYNYNKVKDWGAINWIKPIIEIMMSANSKTVDYHLHQIYGTLKAKDQTDYYRLEPKVITANSEMDDGSVANISKLRKDGISFVSKNDINQELDAIAEKLILYGTN
jgi:patatin-like phospholipase/acyl hydrolase